MSASLWPVRVYYEDTDAAGIVYHANYLKYLERARTEYFEANWGEDLFTMQAREQIQFVIAHISIDFRKPARLGEHLQVHTDITPGNRASLHFDQSIVQMDTQHVICQAVVKAVCVNAQGKPCALPNLIRRTS